jgi:hypothetical protein
MVLSCIDDEEAKKELMELVINNATKGIETTFSKKLDTGDYRFVLYDIKNNKEIIFLISIYDLTHGIMKPYYFTLCEYKNRLKQLIEG